MHLIPRLKKVVAIYLSHNCALTIAPAINVLEITDAMKYAAQGSDTTVHHRSSFANNQKISHNFRTTQYLLKNQAIRLLYR